MNTLSVQISVKIAWWVMPYIRILSAICFITKASPDPEKVANFLLSRGVKLSVVQK